MKQIELKKSHAIVLYGIFLGLLVYGLSVLISLDDSGMASKPFFVVMTRYVMPFVISLGILWEIYLWLFKKPRVVMDSQGIHDETRGFGDLAWDDIVRLQFLSNFGIYQIHVYLKGRKTPARLGPIRIHEEQREVLKREIPVRAIWM